MFRKTLITLNNPDIDVILNKFTNNIPEYKENVLLSNIYDVLTGFGIENIRMRKQYVNICIDLIQSILYPPLRVGIAIIPQCGYIELDAFRVDDYTYITINPIGDKYVIS